MSLAVARMTTRREVLGAGLALASMPVTAGLRSAFPAAAALPDAIVLDEALDISAPLAELLGRRKPALPLLSLRLDSFASIQLRQLFAGGWTIAGLSSGATLFCLERIAWDHGYRLSRHSERASTFNADMPALADAIMGSEPDRFAATISRVSHAYRPSMTDGAVHAWMMQTMETFR